MKVGKQVFLFLFRKAFRKSVFSERVISQKQYSLLLLIFPFTSQRLVREKSPFKKKNPPFRCAGAVRE